MLLCPACQKWEIGAKDTFCSWCGSKLVDFEVSLSSRHVYLSSFAPFLELTIKHVGVGRSFKLDEVSSDRDWLKVDKSYLPDLTLRQGLSLVLPIEIETAGLADDYHTAKVKVRAVDREEDLDLHVVPAPEVKASISEHLNEHTVLFDPESGGALPAHLTIARGVVTAQKISTDISGARIKLGKQTEALPFTLDARVSNRLDFEIVFDPDRARPAEFSGHLIVKYAELDPEREYPFHIKCIQPPRLQIHEDSGPLKFDLFTDQRPLDFSLTLRNGGSDELARGDLQILEKPRLDAAWLQMDGSHSFPLTIPAGKSVQLKFKIDARKAGKGPHKGRITFLTNQPGQKERDISVQLKVEEMQDYNGVLAIDFGTVNSCCAFIDKNGEVRLIEIDNPNHNLKPDVAPSTILYRNKFSDGAREYDIGELPYQSSFDPKAAASTVRQIKRKLGRREPVTISYFRSPEEQDQLLPREITSDIIRRVIERAQERLRARVKQCVVSHPSRFSLRQINDLKAALAACGIDKDDITTMHEPLGAAMDYIHRTSVPGDTRSYHLMVFDFGGGTTDVTLLKVDVRPGKSGKMALVAPVVLGAAGDQRLGGEDVTDMVFNIAIEKIERKLQADNPGAEVSIPFDNVQLTQNDNPIVLRKWAEETKIGLSKYGDEHFEVTSLSKTPYLNVTIGGQHKQQSFEQKDVAPLVSELNGLLRPRLDRIVEQMKRLVEKRKVQSVDVILLSGQSSFLPLVREVIAGAFPASEITNPQDRKRCVVAGACYLHHTDPIANIDIDAESQPMSATPSRLGIRVADSGKTRFKELIDAGDPIPDTGLELKVLDISLRRNTVLRFLENSGIEDELTLSNGEENPDINELTVLRLDQELAKWEGDNKTKITNQMIRDATIELKIDSNLNVKLLVSIPGLEKPIEVKAEKTEE